LLLLLVVNIGYHGADIVGDTYAFNTPVLNNNGHAAIIGQPLLLRLVEWQRLVINCYIVLLAVRDGAACAAAACYRATIACLLPSMPPRA